MTAFVIGNGLSRKGINLSKLNGTTYGCNWLYTDFKPDVLVAVDKPISDYIQNTYYPKEFVFYTREIYANTGARQLNRHYKNWASGSNALQLAVLDKHKKIFLLGFDFGGSQQFDNIYAGTRFYKDQHSKPTYTGKWENEIRTIFRMNNKIEFIIIKGYETNKVVDTFLKYDNVSIISKYIFINDYVDKKDHK